MEIKSVFDPEFKPYGKVLEGYNTAALRAAMNTIPLPESGTAASVCVIVFPYAGAF